MAIESRLSRSGKAGRTRAMVRTLKTAEQDFEWYPTTEEIIDCIRTDLTALDRHHREGKPRASILDCGAGDGRVLNELTDGAKYAIEKAIPLIEALPSDVFLVGTDFQAQTLMDKRVDCVFSNPPYSEYAAWARKIILEANAPLAYLVLPQRWENSSEIAMALKERRAHANVIGRFDFADAERDARAQVEVIRINLMTLEFFSLDHGPRIDPFDLWFRTHFKLDISERASPFHETRRNVQDQIKHAGELIKDQGLVNTLQALYQRDMDHLMHNYLAVCDLDPDLLRELEVNVASVKAALKLKVSSLKDIYWQELFNKLASVTDRLTSDSRKLLLDKLTAHTHVDFSADNAHAIVIWVIKNANQYFDSQLVGMMERMTEQANIINYKSNQRTFRDEDWRYCWRPPGIERYMLEYRVVLEHVGGIATSCWAHENPASGLSDHAATFLGDLCTLAYNLGFDTFAMDSNRAHSRAWASGKKQLFHYRDQVTGELRVLFEAKAFKNGNLHIRFDQNFMMRLNVEFGRLKGWIKNAAHAAQEMDIPADVAASMFHCNLQLRKKDVLLLAVA